MPHTNVSKLIYVAPTPKNTPTKGKLKSIHRYTNKTGQKTNQNVKRNKDFSRKTVSDEFLKNSLEQNVLKQYINSSEYMTNPENILGNKPIKKEKCYISDFKDKTLKKKEKNSNRIQTIQTKLDECIGDRIELQSPRSSLRFLNSKLIKKDMGATNHSSFNQTNKEVTEEEDITIESNTPFVKLKCFIKSERDNRNLDENVNPKNKNRTNKEEIKKRLKELHKNSLRILEINLKKGKKTAYKEKFPKNEENLTKLKKLTLNDHIFSKPHTNEIHYKNEIINNLILDKVSVKSDKGQVCEKVGLLRHSVSDEHTFNNFKDYDINKEKELLKSLSISKFNLVTEKRSDATNISKEDFDNRIKGKLGIKSQETESQQEKNNRNKSEKAIQVEIALNNNKENISNLEKFSGSNDFINSVQLQTPLSHKKNTEGSKINSCKNIPYWLQQTSVEIYPYNFITAVRKKLEVLTNPVTKNTEDQYKKKVNKNYHTTYQEAPLPQSKSENDNMTMRRRIIDNVNLGKLNSNQMHSQITKNEFHLANNINISNILVNKNIPSSNFFNKAQNSDSLSDTISNFSSISLHCPEADTISDISSVKSEVQIWKVPRKKLSSCKKILNYENSQNDDTTISSSIFSSSEHKDFLNSIKQPQECHIADFSENIDQSPSPLSLYNITNLQINLKRNNSNTNINKNLSKKLSSKLKSQTDIKPNNDDKGMAENDQNISQLDQLLEDFNKNLSQVVEVNNQLKSTLDKSKKQMNHQHKNIPINPKLSSSSFITAVEYTSDFEDYVSNATLVEPINNLTKKDNKHNTSSSKLSEDISSKFDVQSIKENIQHDKASSQSDANEVALNKIQTIISSNNDDFIKNHVNTLRGNDDRAITKGKSTLVYVDETKTQQGKQNLDLDLTFGKNIEISMILQDENSVSSKISQNYSSIGVYEQLLQSENLKTEHLTALLKIREKILVDRTKTQIAWLEVQKEKYKHKGLSEQITAIKKKQRAILIRMEKKRGEIKKLMKSRQHNSICHPAKMKEQNSLFNALSTNLSKSLSNLTIRKGLSTTTNNIESGTKSVRAYDIGSSQNLVKLLEKREEELKHRREYVERLIAWHKRLDEEEDQVYEMEQNLLNCNKNIRLLKSNESLINQINTDQPILFQEELKKEKKVIEIEKSLGKLQNMSQCSKENSNVADYVRISGHKLNKLWARLTGQRINRFDSNKKYKFTKTDLETFYERAKEKVIKEFDKFQNLEEFLDSSLQHNLALAESCYDQDPTEQIFAKNLDIPSLYLNFSSESNKNSLLESSLTQQNEDQDCMKQSSTISDCDMEKLVDKKMVAVTNNNATTDLYEIKNKCEEEQHNLNIASKASKDLQKNVKNCNPIFKTDIFIYEQQESLSYGKINSMKNYNETQIQERSLKNASTRREKNNILILKEFASSNKKEGSVETNFITNRITENSKTKNFELVRPSVIVSSNSYLNEIFKPKKEIKSVTMVELNEKQQTITPLIKSSHHISGNIQTSESINSSAKLPSSILKEELQSDKSLISTTNSLSDDEPLLILSDKKIPSSEIILQQQMLHNPFIKKTFENKNQYNYQYDIPASDLTNLENISMPIFETTIELFKKNELVFDVKPNNNESSKDSENATELKKRLIVIDESLKDLNETIEKVLSPEKEKLATNTINFTISNSDNSTVSVEKTITSVSTMKPSSFSTKVIEQHTDSLSSTVLTNTKPYDKMILMPDIINEVEIRRRQQILVQSGINNFENTIPYVVVREIPNKPPPPYVPPAHGSPMTTIFPPESRMKDLTFRRTAELFKELIKRNEFSENVQQFNSKNSVLNENITNIYERIILDICKECVQEYEEIFHDVNAKCYKKSLALYNPPDKLDCIQKFIYCRVRNLLGIEKNCHRKSSIFFIAKKKRDHVDEILIQELFEEDYKWTNFDEEEIEVKISIVEHILNDVIKDVVIDLLKIKNKYILNY